jgi:hypothetical protein
VTTDREDLRALRAEVDIDRRAAAAVLAGLNRRVRGIGRHVRHQKSDVGSLKVEVKLFP